ncbi:uncharacterized protein LOC130548915 isoform X2 [Triplophysa rosa]|uniref:uncharacterized protein LOC130548915 isoform X2 n=1 Tax=Triplophysa rosa TaxID=992332 RepID=UPI002545F749|nr:uncharacterized protein LOC130548915 isoform X2 [Triplophysa rosa]XP_057181959.1 uncharacterized protein LOC130548915 isoform X2 [Triplophysa rosa]
MMKNMSHPLFILFFLLRLLCDVSSDGVQTGMVNSHDTEIPEITRDYLIGSKCAVVCSVSSVSQANLTWYNGSNLYSSVMISDFNTKLYLEVEHQDKSNYSCVLSSTHINSIIYLNVSRLCQSCSGGTIKMMPVSDGESVTLSTNLKERQKDMQWYYYENSFIWKLLENTTIYHKHDDGRFTNKLQVDNNTGSLTINNIREINAGLFLLITYKPLMDQLCYKVTVNDHLPVPVITRNSSQCSSSSERSSVSKCVLLCSVMNVTHVSLSWYKGKSLLSSISVSDLIISLSLHLEVEFQDTNTYRCVIKSSFSNKTTQLNFNELCKDHQQSNVIAFVGVALAVVAVAACVLLIWWKRKFPRQKGNYHLATCTLYLYASAEHDVVRFVAAQANGASAQDTSDNRPNEESRLITSLSQENMPSNQHCCF